MQLRKYAVGPIPLPLEDAELLVLFPQSGFAAKQVKRFKPKLSITVEKDFLSVQVVFYVNAKLTSR